MATKSVFVSRYKYPYFEEIGVDCTWFGGFANTQKIKCIISVHENFKRAYPEFRVCEISGASPFEIGRRLSAMSLTKEIPSAGAITSVESAFQSSRIYTNLKTGEKIGAFKDCLFMDGRDCKRTVKERSQGLHSYDYEFEGMNFPAPDFHISLFYDWLYLNALLENGNAETRDILLRSNFTAFTDLATSALNSQARSCAIFVALEGLGLISEVKNFDSFCKLFRVDISNKKNFAYDNSYENVQLLNQKGRYNYLSPVVPDVISVDEIEKYRIEHYSHIINKRSSYLRQSLDEVISGNVRGRYSIFIDNTHIGYRIVTSTGCVDIPCELGSDGVVGEDYGVLRLEYSDIDGIWISDIELKQRVIYPEIEPSNIYGVSWLKSL